MSMGCRQISREGKLKYSSASVGLVPETSNANTMVRKPVVFCMWLGNRTTYSIGVVGEYRHLGGLVHATGDMRKEIRRRLAIAHSTFSKFRRLLFHNNAFTQAKRVTILSDPGDVAIYIWH